MRETDFVGGFAKGLRVIEAFGETAQHLSIADVARLTGLDRATARRSLLTLAELGYAAYDGKFFSLTPRILRLGHAYLSATPITAVLQPHLDRLSERLGQSASASVLDGTEIVYIARAAQRRVMSISLMAGSRLPAWCTSMGRVLLSTLPEEEARALLSRSALKANTPHTIADPEALMAELARVRRQGYALIDQELEAGLRSVAVPVAGARGRTVAAINIGAPAAHAALADMRDRYVPALKETAAAISAQLG